ncbi:MAG: hypothetical protein RLZZ157_53 [Pseudomonadota bacterium]|jgi:hypothetical protein
MDNLSNHKRLSVKLLIEAAGATLAFLPPHSPDLNPIEKAFSKLKANLRRIGESTISGLWDVIGSLVTMFNPQECQKDFSNCGYDAHEGRNPLNQPQRFEAAGAVAANDDVVDDGDGERLEGADDFAGHGDV